MKKSLLSIAVLAAMIVGCKKDEDEKTRKELMVGNWNVTEYGVDANNNSVVDGGELFPASDSTVNGAFTFNSDGTFSLISKFLGLGSDTTTGQWALLNNDTYIRTIVEGDTSVAEINSFAANKVILRDTADAQISGASWVVLSK